MPWRLIGILIILTLFLIFSGFNVHKVTVYFGPFALTDIPLFVVIVFTFILGAFTALPVSIITSYKKRKKKMKKEEKASVKESRQINQGPVNQTVSLEKNTAEEKKKKSKAKKK